MGQINRSKLIISIIIIIIIAGLGFLSFLDVNLPIFNYFERLVYNVSSSLLEGSTRLCRTVTARWNSIINSQKLIEENRELRKKIAELEIDNIQRKYHSEQNYRLRKLLDFDHYQSFETMGAEVIGYSTSYWDHKIIINRGSSDGIENRMPVITYDGALLGKVDYVGHFTSQVLLINDPNFAVGGIVEREDSRAIGLVKGQIDEKNINIIEDISWNRESREGDIKIGDIIVTSGLSNSFPRGIPIGEVINVEQDNYGLTQKADIDLFMSKNTVEEVLVITEFRGE